METLTIITLANITSLCIFGGSYVYNNWLKPKPIKDEIYEIGEEVLFSVGENKKLVAKIESFSVKKTGDASFIMYTLSIKGNKGGFRAGGRYISKYIPEKEEKPPEEKPPEEKSVDYRNSPWP